MTKQFKIVTFLMTLLFFSGQINAQISNPFKKKNSKIDFFKEESSGGPHYDKYVGKVVFSNSEIEREDSDSEYITSYTLGDPLYIRSYLNQSVTNSVMKQVSEKGIDKIKNINKIKQRYEIKSRLIYILYLDGNRISNSSHTKNLSSIDRKELISLRATLNDGTPKNYPYELPYKTLEANEKLLTPGTHKLKIEVVALLTALEEKFDPIASGEIDLIVSEDGIKINLDDCFPKAKMKNKKLEEDIERVISQKMVAGSKISDVIISSTKWTILTNYLDQPIKKSIRAIIVFTDAEGTVFYTERIFEKVYDGGKYSPLAISKDLNIKGEGTADVSNHIVNSKCSELLD